MEEKTRKEIEQIVGDYCDGTFAFKDGELIFSLENAHFCEWFSDGKRGPRELVDRLIAHIERLLDGRDN